MFLFLLCKDKRIRDKSILSLLKPKYDDRMFVDSRVFTCCATRKSRQEQVKTRKSTNNRSSSFGLTDENMELSRIHLAVMKKLTTKMTGNQKMISKNHALFYFV